MEMAAFPVECNEVLFDYDSGEDENKTVKQFTTVEPLGGCWTATHGNNCQEWSSSQISTYGNSITGPAVIQGEPNAQNAKGKPHLCEYCVEELPDQAALVRHCSVTHGRHFFCANCTKAFKQLVHIKVHIRCVHTPAKPFKCDICLRAFNVKSNLSKHRKLHSQNGSRYLNSERDLRG